MENRIALAIALHEICIHIYDVIIIFLWRLLYGYMPLFISTGAHWHCPTYWASLLIPSIFQVIQRGQEMITRSRVDRWIDLEDIYYLSILYFICATRVVGPMMMTCVVEMFIYLNMGMEDIVDCSECYVMLMT